MAKKDQRNPVARAAIMRKGGVHEKCRTAKRQQQKRELEKTVSEYLAHDKTVADSDRFFLRVQPLLPALPQQRLAQSCLNLFKSLQRFNHKLNSFYIGYSHSTSCG